MNFKLTELTERKSLITIMFLQLAVYVTMLLDIPIFRQVLGFFYLTFLPGFFILKLLRLNELDGVETALFSVGLSIASLMFAGLFINEICFLFGISQPLSIIPLMIILNCFILLGGVLVYLRRGNPGLLRAKTLRLSPLMLLAIFLPILSIIGTTCSKIYGSNLILLFMIITIALLLAAGIISQRFLPPNLYALTVVMIAVSLLYHSSLVSKYMIHFGSDVSGEVFVLKIVEKDAHWSPTNPYAGDLIVGRSYGMLSVTILPLVYSNLLNLDSIWVLKALYPLIFSLVPLGLYKVWGKFMNDKYAFVSTFFFMAYQTFYTEMLGLSKQMIGELFVVLLLFVILNKRLRSVGKMLLFSLFSFALVVSHYALAEIFLVLISFVLISLVMMKKRNRRITLTMVLCFFAIMFSWYLYTSSSAVFDASLNFGEHVYGQLGEFFNPASRGQIVLRGLGMEAPPSIWNTISRVFAYVTQVSIVIGLFGVVTKRARANFALEYFLLNLFAMIFLVALLLIPGLADTLNMTRFYHILLFFLAPLCVLGVETIVKIVSKRKTEAMVPILLAVVLVPYFLFQTGFVYEVTGSESWSVPLSKHRMNGLQLHGYLGYTDAFSVFGAEWLSNNVAVGQERIYSDVWSRVHELRGYGAVYVGYVEILSNTTDIKPNGIVYLSSLNVNHGIIQGVRSLWNSSELIFLHNLNKIYSNGGSEIYENEP